MKCRSRRPSQTAPSWSPSTIPSNERSVGSERGTHMKPGEVFTPEADVALNVGRETCVVSVANTGDRPIQVGSHYHFFETNPALVFERALARGFRLNIP